MSADLDGLPRYREHHCPGIGIKYPDGLNVIDPDLQILGFADDFVVIASTVEDLQRVANANHDCWKLMDMSLMKQKPKIFA